MMESERLTQLFEYLNSGDTDPFVRYAIATEYLRLEEPLEALNYFEALIKDHPEYLGTYYHLGKLLLRIGRSEEAVDVFREGIKIADDARDLHARRELKEALNQAIGGDEE